MIFCGAGSEQVLDGGSSSAGKLPEPGVDVSSNFRCGGCTATIDSNETMFPTANLLSEIEDEDSSDEEEGEEEPNNMKQLLEHAASSKPTHQQPLKAALDSIQQTLDDPQNDSNSLSKIAIGAGGSPTKTKMKRDGTTISAAFNASHSPNLLNPLTPDWKEPPTTNKELNSKLLCPILDTCASISSSLETVVQRLEKGFWVRLIRGPTPYLAGHHRVRLHLHEDRTRFWIESADRMNSPSDEVDLGIELPVNIILRLEVGSNPKAFSIVLEKKRGELLYYDFEATTVIDREIMATSIMLLLDQTHNSCGEDEVGDEDWTGGTEEQPIPCSPSLEKDRFNEFHQLSPTRRTRIFNSVNNRETETSLVIHLEDMTVSASDVSIRAGDEWSCRSVPTLSSQPRKGRTDEQSLDCKPSASSTHLGLNAVSSANLAATAWCPADSCALALNDIADTCTGIFALKQGETSCVGNEHQVVVEEFIASALGAPTAVYAYLTERDIWNMKGSSSTHQASRDARNAVFRNRASLLNAQATRLRGLRNEMTFAAALKQSKEKMQFVQTVQSFDDVYARSAGTKKLKAATRAANRFHSSALLQTVVGNMKMHDTNGNSMEEEGGVAFYDSDPEDSRPRNSKKGPRQLAASRIQVTNDATPAASHHQALSGVGFDEIGSGKKVSKRLDEETIVDIVHSMNNERLTLMWHPTQTKGDKNRSPVCVRVWIESGVYLNDGTFLLPKLTWAKALQADSLKQKALEKIDLLDICRIRPTMNIDRRLHPFALTQKSFYVETLTEVFVFQAQTIEERDRIVYGLKLVVARLASLLMLRDVRAAEEFFGAFSNTVPGEAPTSVWLKERDSDSSAASSTCGAAEIEKRGSRRRR